MSSASDSAKAASTASCKASWEMEQRSGTWVCLIARNTDSMASTSSGQAVGRYKERQATCCERGQGVLEDMATVAARDVGPAVRRRCAPGAIGAHPAPRGEWAVGIQLGQEGLAAACGILVGAALLFTESHPGGVHQLERSIHKLPRDVTAGDFEQAFETVASVAARYLEPARATLICDRTPYGANLKRVIIDVAARMTTSSDAVTRFLLGHVAKVASFDRQEHLLDLAVGLGLSRMVKPLDDTATRLGEITIGKNESDWILTPADATVPVAPAKGLHITRAILQACHDAGETIDEVAVLREPSQPSGKYVLAARVGPLWVRLYRFKA